MPVIVRDWLSEGLLAWFRLDAVDAIDLAQFYVKYRTKGWGCAAYDHSDARSPYKLKSE